jgi:hypothetical protein
LWKRKKKPCTIHQVEYGEIKNKLKMATLKPKKKKKPPK